MPANQLDKLRALSTIKKVDIHSPMPDFRVPHLKEISEQRRFHASKKTVPQTRFKIANTVFFVCSCAPDRAKTTTNKTGGTRHRE